jgi:hypothetical protein
MKTSDGREFAHKGMGSSWQGHIDRNPGAAMKPQGGEQEGGENESVVAEHGPAHTTHIMEDKQQPGSYQVHSHHRDGHMHKSKHGSVHEAHEHSLKMHGAGEEDHQPGEQAEGGEHEPMSGSMA